ncbi:MAG: AsmA family protein [Pseudomonadota bacterium]
MRILLYALLGLVALLVSAVLIGPSFIDWNAQKDRIAGEVRKITGRELKIDGDMELAVLPAPALLADGVRFANLAGGSTPYMIELKELRVKVKLLPLLQGRIEVESVFLAEPKIVLEVLPNGQKNWEFETADTNVPASDAPAAEDDFAGQVAVESFTISDGTLVYLDEAQGLREELSQVDLQFVAESLSGPFSAVGTAAWHDIALSFDTTLGRIVRDGAMPLKIELGLPSARAESQFSGTLSLHRDGLSLRGRLGASGENLASAMAAMTPNDPSLSLPGYLAQSFELAANLSGDTDELAIEGLRLKLGKISFTGQSNLVRGPPHNVAVSLNATRLDIDSFLAAGLGQGGDGRGVGGNDLAIDQISLPADVNGRLELVVEGLVYRGQALRQLQLDAILESRQLTLGEARALLPGGSSVSLTGKLTSSDAGPRFDGRTELSSDNLRALLTWAGLDVSAVPADRLRRLSLKTLIAATPHQASLNELDLELDLSRVTGGVVAALRDRPGLGIGLSVDTLNLDAYLPITTDAQNQPTEGRDLAALDAFDANLDFHVGSLTAEGMTAKDVQVDGTWEDGVLTVRKASVGDVAGSQASLSGVLSSPAGGPVFDGSLDLRVKDPLRLAKLTGLDTDALALLGPFNLVTALRGTTERLIVDSQLAALDGRFGFVGTIEPPRFDGQIALRHGELSDLLTALDPSIDRLGQLGTLDFAGRAVGDSSAVTVSQLDGQAGPLGLTGGFSADLSEASPLLRDLSLDLSLRHANGHELLASLGQPDLVSPELGAIDLSGKLTGGARVYTLSELKGQIGPTDVSGTLSADFAAGRPVMGLSLSTGELPLALLGAPAKDAGDESAPRWSPQPFELNALRTFDGTLEVNSTAMVDGAFRLEDAKLNARLEHGVLALEKLTGGLHGGAFQAIGQLDARTTPQFGLALTLIGLKLGTFLPAHGGSDRIKGPVDMDLEVSSRGDSEAALIGALRGTGKLSGSVTFETTSAEGIGAMTLNFLGNRFKQVTSLAGLTTSIYDTFAGEPTRLSGTYLIDRGVVTTKDTALSSPKGIALLTGQASLPLWQQDSQIEIQSKTGVTKPLLKLTLQGPLNDPNVALSGMSPGLFKRIPEPSPEESPEGESESSPTLPGQGLIKNIIEGLQP